MVSDRTEMWASYYSLFDLQLFYNHVLAFHSLSSQQNEKWFLTGQKCGLHTTHCLICNRSIIIHGEWRQIDKTELILVYERVKHSSRWYTTLTVHSSSKDFSGVLYISLPIVEGPHSVASK